MLNPRAIAVQGLGFHPRAVINMGYFDAEIVIEPEFTSGTGGQTIDDVKVYKIHVKFTDHLGYITKHSYTLSDGALFMQLKYQKMVIKPLTIRASLTNIDNPIKIVATLIK